MGALASTERQACGLNGRTEPSRANTVKATHRGSSGQRQTSWNVLAQELVPYPPGEAAASHRGQRQAPSSGRETTSHTIATNARTRLVSNFNRGAYGEMISGQGPSSVGEATPSAVRDHDRAGRASSRRPAPGSRGLRRLLPGAATLAVLVSIWFGAGALSSLHRPAMTVPAAAVRAHGGYLYVARPGDTLWSIASKLQPGGDPRPLVAELEQQLHGGELVVGDRLTLP